MCLLLLGFIGFMPLKKTELENRCMYTHTHTHIYTHIYLYYIHIHLSLSRSIINAINSDWELQFQSNTTRFFNLFSLPCYFLSWKQGHWISLFFLPYLLILSLLKFPQTRFRFANPFLCEKEISLYKYNNGLDFFPCLAWAHTVKEYLN